MERHRRPPDVEEALSSMLWTPYQCSPSDSSDEETECNLRARNTTANKLQSKITATDLYSITDQHLYSKPIRYRSNFASNYGYFVPKTYNSLHCELPSYEHVEKERSFSRYFFAGFNTSTNHSNSIAIDNANNNYNGNGNGNSTRFSGCHSNNNNANCPSNGIYMIHEHSKCATSMVHSFTDDFLQYQVNKSLDFMQRSYFYQIMAQLCARSCARAFANFQFTSVKMSCLLSHPYICWRNNS